MKLVQQQVVVECGTAGDGGGVSQQGRGGWGSSRGWVSSNRWWDGRGISTAH
jgi:hypothetical protein